MKFLVIFVVLVAAAYGANTPPIGTESPPISPPFPPQPAYPACPAIMSPTLEEGPEIPPPYNCQPFCYSPVCGTNGVQFIGFANTCIFNSYNAELATGNIEDKMVLTKYDQCRTFELDQCKTIKCANFRAPVCGTNGYVQTTYINFCHMSAASCSGEPISYVGSGPCV